MDALDVVFKILMDACVVVLVVIGVGFVGMVFFGQQTTNKIEIESVSDGTRLYSAFLGGSNEKPEYFFYAKTGNGYKLNSATANKITVYEDSSKPYILNHCVTFWYTRICSVDELHVPEGSIKSGVSLDLNGRIR